MSSVSPRTNGASVSNDFCYIKPLCSPLLCVTIHQSSNLKRYHSKLLKTPIYALFVCSLRILFTKPYVLTKAIEILKGRSMQNRNVLLLLCLSFTLSFIYSVYKQLVNSSTCQLVNLPTK